MISRERRGRIATLLACASLSSLTSTALAEPPSVQACLDASDASLQQETRGELLATRAALRTCASLSCPQEVRDECTRRLGLVEQSIASVVCEVRDGSGHVRPDATVNVDGEGADAPAGEPVEVDPGTHVLRATAPGEMPATRRVTLSAHEKNRRVVIVLPSPPSRALPPRRVGALVAGGVGVTSLAVAAVFGIIALDRKADAQSSCPNATCPTAFGSQRWADAAHAGNFSTGFAVGGVAALALAAGLWFSVDHRLPSVGVGPTGLRLKARF